MNRLNRIVGIVAALTCTATLAAAPQSPKKPPKGFTSLFNGKDLSGWRGRQPNYNPVEESKLSPDEHKTKQADWNTQRDAHWKVDTAKQEIVSDGQSPHLATAKDYADFEFYVDWLMVNHNGDSGIYLRGYPQVQVWDPDNPREPGWTFTNALDYDEDTDSYLVSSRHLSTIASVSRGGSSKRRSGAA